MSGGILAEGSLRPPTSGLHILFSPPGSPGSEPEWPGDGGAGKRGGGGAGLPGGWRGQGWCPGEAVGPAVGSLEPAGVGAMRAQLPWAGAQVSTRREKEQLAWRACEGCGDRLQGRGHGEGGQHAGDAERGLMGTSLRWQWPGQETFLRHSLA